MKTKKLLSVVLAAAMAISMLPTAAFAESGDLNVEGNVFTAVPADRIQSVSVSGVSSSVEDGKVAYTVSATDTSDWDQVSGSGSVDSYTYVGIYVTAPEGATKLKRNSEGSYSGLKDITGDFFSNGRYQEWFPVADKQSDGSYSLFYGGRQYTVIMEWYDDADKLISREYVKVTRDLADPVASVGGYTYESLAAAVAAAKDGDTVKLLRNASGSGIVIDTKNYSTSGLVIDFGGYTYTVDSAPLAGSTGTENQCFQLLTGGSVTMKNGTVNSTNPKVAMIIQNYCNLTLDGMNVDGTGMSIAGAYTLSNNCGNVVINNSKITAAGTASAVAFDVYGGFGNYSDVKVTVKGNSVITGKVEVARGTSSNNRNDLVIEGGTFNGELSVTEHANSAVSVSGGIFNTPLDAKLVKDDTAMIKDADGKYYVGGDASARIATLKSGETVEVISAAGGEVKVPEGVVVTNSTGEDLKVNGNTVKDGEKYTVPAAPAPAPAPSYDWNGVLASINALGGKGSIRVDVGSELSVPHFIWQAIYGKNITVTFVRGQDSFVVNGRTLGANFDPDTGHMLTEFSATRTNPNTGVKL